MRAEKTRLPCSRGRACPAPVPNPGAQRASPRGHLNGLIRHVTRGRLSRLAVPFRSSQLPVSLVCPVALSHDPACQEVSLLGARWSGVLVLLWAWTGPPPPGATWSLALRVLVMTSAVPPVYTARKCLLFKHQVLVHSFPVHVCRFGGPPEPATLCSEQTLETHRAASPLKKRPREYSCGGGPLRRLQGYLRPLQEPPAPIPPGVSPGTGAAGAAGCQQGPGWARPRQPQDQGPVRRPPPLTVPGGETLAQNRQSGQ